MVSNIANRRSLGNRGWREKMEKILEIIGNKKLISAFERNDLKSFGQIAGKLYKKARLTQDKVEYLLGECLKYSRNESVDLESALNSYKEIKCEEMGLKARSDIECSAKFIEEQDALKRYDMKLDAYEDACEACINYGV